MRLEVYKILYFTYLSEQDHLSCGWQMSYHASWMTQLLSISMLASVCWYTQDILNLLDIFPIYQQQKFSRQNRCTLEWRREW